MIWIVLHVNPSFCRRNTRTTAANEKVKTVASQEPIQTNPLHSNHHPQHSFSNFCPSPALSETYIRMPLYLSPSKDDHNYRLYSSCFVGVNNHLGTVGILEGESIKSNDKAQRLVVLLILIHYDIYALRGDGLVPVIRHDLHLEV